MEFLLKPQKRHKQVRLVISYIFICISFFKANKFHCRRPKALSKARSPHRVRSFKYLLKKPWKYNKDNDNQEDHQKDQHKDNQKNFMFKDFLLHFFVSMILSPHLKRSQKQFFCCCCKGTSLLFFHTAAPPGSLTQKTSGCKKWLP